MASVDSALAELNAFLSKVWEDAKADGVKKASLVVSTRRDLLEKITAIHAAAQNDDKFRGNPQAFREFDERLMQLRHDLARLNSKWRAADLDANFEGYAYESRPIAENCANFVRWAQAARAGL